MKALFQRLKELDPSTFEDLCFQIWDARLAGIGLRQVEGKGGDKGTDMFTGVLQDKPTIWQCKFFPDGIKDAQKKQIKKSLKTALQNFTPAVWTLCVPIKLTVSAHSWFQELTKAHSTTVGIELFDAPAIVRELIFRDQIRDVFFPGAVLDVAEIKSALLGTDSQSDHQLDKLSSETVRQYVDRLRKNEPRCDYQISYLSGTSGLEATKLPIRQLFPGTIVSVLNGNRRLDVVARDTEALSKNPPQIKVTLTAQGIGKLRDGFRSGSPIELGQDELLGFKSSFDFLMPPEPIGSITQLRIEPILPTVTASLRVGFASRDERVVYDLVEFLVTKRNKCFEFNSTSAHVPFQMHLKLGPTNNDASFEITPKFIGSRVLEVQKFLAAINVLRCGGEIELFDLKQQVSLGSIGAALNPPNEEQRAFEKLVEELSEVATAFGQPFFLVSDLIGQDDLEALAFLIEVCRHGETEAGTAEGLTATLVRREEPVANVLDLISGEFVIGLENDNYPAIKLLSVDVPVGPCRLLIDKTRVKDFERVKTQYQSLTVGDSMPVRFESTGSVRQIFPKFYKGEPLVPFVEL